mgnify:CR=1 FL=1
MEELVKRAAEIVKEADVLLLTAGAGLGVDSGLPDFRGNEGFWKAYPAYGHLGIEFMDLANPRRFLSDPELAWGFYAHRQQLYAKASPHEAYHTMLAIAKSKKEHFVYTSNVDGYFVRTGFAPRNVFEVHGNIFWCQCQRSMQCGQLLFQHKEKIDIDPETMRADIDKLPVCPTCGIIARPNILMFGDAYFDDETYCVQESQYERFLLRAYNRMDNYKVAIIECGAGTSIPTIRRLGDHFTMSHPRATLVRINLHEPHVYPGHVGLAMSAAEAIAQIKELL